MIDSPEFIAPQTYGSARAALAQVQRLHTQACVHLRQTLAQSLARGQPPERLQRAFYPCVRVQVRAEQAVPSPSAASHGFVAGSGRFETTLTRPDLFADYLLEQFEGLIERYGALEVAISHTPMALPFALDAQASSWPQALDDAQRARWQAAFDWPDLAAMDDAVANGTCRPAPGQARALALFAAPRIDLSLQRLRHYCGSDAGHFQRLVLFTNYAFYVDAFIEWAKGQLADPASGFETLVQPEMAAGRLPQMPAYHLTRADRLGVTLVNIGVGPANAKTLTDHLAVLRPHAWIMVGHCAGLRSTQRLGDYVLAHAYVREDHVLDEDLPPWVPVPALAEIQQALQHAVADVTGRDEAGLRTVLRTGTVASTDNRNWELLPDEGLQRRLAQSRAIAIDMESATIAANGFRLRVPYGTLLCVSDRPLHGELKLPGMASAFYTRQVAQHLHVGLRALELLRQRGVAQLHSRKLRSWDEVAFQ